MIGLLVFVVLIPVLWQLPRSFWPVRLDPGGTHFLGLYQRYSVGTFTGYASDIRTWSDKQTVGSVSAQSTGTVIGGSFVGSTTINDRRRTFEVHHTGFFLKDAKGETQRFDAANVRPLIGEGHLVSAAWLVHNGKSGNTFLVYNHTTDEWFLETTRNGMKNAPRGLFKMVFPLPVVYQVLLILAIVTIPVVVIIGVGVHWQVRSFRNRGARPLVSALKQRAAGMPSRVNPSSNDVIDLVTQVKEITALHESGALSVDEFQAAKAKVLGR